VGWYPTLLPVLRFSSRAIIFGEAPAFDMITGTIAALEIELNISGACP
jgi:hypothetical protein